jgi:hypothetical protein
MIAIKNQSGSIAIRFWSKNRIPDLSVKSIHDVFYRAENENRCSVENLSPNKLYEPVKVSENDLAWNFFLLNLEYPGFQVSSEPSFEEREFGLDEEPSSVPGSVEILGHLFSIFPPNMFGTFPGSWRNNRDCFQIFADNRCIFSESYPRSMT